MTLFRQLAIMRRRLGVQRLQRATIVAGITLMIAVLTGCSSSPPQPVMYLHEPQFVSLQLDAGRLVKGRISDITSTSLAAPR